MRLFDKSVLGRCAVLVMDHFDLWLFPTVLLTAWFYYPYCQIGPTLCIWKTLLRTQCLGCGLTRGVCFLVHGRMHDAVRFNPLSVVVVLSMAVTFSKAVANLPRFNRRRLNAIGA